MARKYIDFEVIKEAWNKYELQDGTKLKVRTILQEVWVEKTNGGLIHRTSISQIQTWLCDPKVQGKPDTTVYTKEQIQKHIEVQKCPYTTLQYEPSEYLLDDGTQLMIHSNLLGIARTSLYHNTGDRIYLPDSNIHVNVQTPPNKD